MSAYLHRLDCIVGSYTCQLISTGWIALWVFIHVSLSPQVGLHCGYLYMSAYLHRLDCLPDSPIPWRPTYTSRAHPLSSTGPDSLDVTSRTKGCDHRKIIHAWLERNCDMTIHKVWHLINQWDLGPIPPSLIYLSYIHQNYWFSKRLSIKIIFYIENLFLYKQLVQVLRHHIMKLYISTWHIMSFIMTL